MTGLYKIEISKTLYYFDEPILFVAKVGILNCLFLKTDDLEEGREFLSCYVDENNLAGLLDGRLSVRGAFEAQKDNFLVVSNGSYHVISERKAEPSELLERLPEPNVGVFEHLGECPDVLQEKDAFLSIYFRGSQLRSDHIKYSTLMRLLGSVQGLARNVVVPPALRGFKASTFDFLVGDPALGSLMVSIKEPTFNLQRVRQAQHNQNLTREQLELGVSRHKDAFFSGVKGLFDDATDGHGGGELLDSEVFEGIKEFLPSDETPYSNVTLSTQDGGKLRRISISKERADAVRARFKSSNSAKVTRSGVVVEINAASATLLLRTASGAIVTCAFDRDSFSQLRRQESFKIGAQVKLTGDLVERTRRDYLTVSNFEFVNQVDIFS